MEKYVENGEAVHIGVVPVDLQEVLPAVHLN